MTVQLPRPPAQREAPHGDPARHAASAHGPGWTPSVTPGAGGRRRRGSHESEHDAPGPAPQRTAPWPLAAGRPAVPARRDAAAEEPAARTVVMRESPGATETTVVTTTAVTTTSLAAARSGAPRPAPPVPGRLAIPPTAPPPAAPAAPIPPRRTPIRRPPEPGTPMRRNGAVWGDPIPAAD